MHSDTGGKKAAAAGASAAGRTPWCHPRADALGERSRRTSTTRLRTRRGEVPASGTPRAIHPRFSRDEGASHRRARRRSARERGGVAPGPTTDPSAQEEGLSRSPILERRRAAGRRRGVAGDSEGDISVSSPARSGERPLTPTLSPSPGRGGGALKASSRFRRASAASVCSSAARRRGGGTTATRGTRGHTAGRRAAANVSLSPPARMPALPNRKDLRR